MRIQNIVNFYSPLKQRILTKDNPNSYMSCRFNNGQYGGDVVSFRAKNYDINSILNPTGHCAYCGCKVYTEQQIEALAKSMLGNKSHRLQGDIKSVLEKLNSAVRSEELTFAKKVENAEEIEFFTRFLQFASDNSYMKGDEILRSFYNLESNEAIDYLKLNMRPLIRTIDHVSPQNLAEENNNSDINLVEACYCCNHDLKKGVTFSEFYAMFPSIKENMPTEKFDYAYSGLISSASSGVVNRMSATNLIKHIERLAGQRREALDRVKIVEFRLSEAAASIDSCIESCKSELEAKRDEKLRAEEKLTAISSDEEYTALVKRIQLVNQREQADAVLSSLRERKNSASDSINSLRNPSKKNKRQTKASEMTPEEKEERIQSLKNMIASLNKDIKEQESVSLSIVLSIIELDEQFPTIEMLQGLKNAADNIVSAYLIIEKEEASLEQFNQSLLEIDSQIDNLENQIAGYPSEDFSPEQFSPEEQADYEKYLQYLDAMKHISSHSSGNGLKSVINIAAKPFIEAEIERLEATRIVKAAIDYNHKKDLQAELETLKKTKTDIQNKINSSERRISLYRKTADLKTKEEASAESMELSARIRRLNEKTNYLLLPKTISKLQSEILLLEQTIAVLNSKKSEIVF